MLQQEAYPTNSAALARVRIIWDRAAVHGPFIIEKSGQALWNQVELIRVVDGTDTGAPTVRNTVKKIVTYVRDNPTAFARDQIQPSAAEIEKRALEICGVGDELERLANESEYRPLKYAEFETLLGRLHLLGFYPTNKQVGDVSHAIMGEELARAVA
jgi:hypothetical protein